MPKHTSVEGLVLKPTRRDDPVGLVVMAGNPGNARHKVSQEGVPPARLLGDYKPRSVDQTCSTVEPRSHDVRKGSGGRTVGRFAVENMDAQRTREAVF